MLDGFPRTFRTSTLTYTPATIWQNPSTSLRLCRYTFVCFSGNALVCIASDTLCNWIVIHALHEKQNSFRPVLACRFRRSSFFQTKNTLGRKTCDLRLYQGSSTVQCYLLLKCEESRFHPVSPTSLCASASRQQSHRQLGNSATSEKTKL